MSEFKVGDVVAVAETGIWKTTPIPRKVEVVHKKYLVLDDGTKWSLSGYAYGRKGYSRIELWGPKDDERVVRRSLASNIRLVKEEDLDKLSIEEAKTITTLLTRVRDT